MLEHFSKVADNYHGCIIDLWGVVHDGQKPFAHSVRAMANLREKGKTVCLLSNAPSRSRLIAQHLANMGVDQYDFVMTSGELVWQGMKNRKEADLGGLQGRAYVIGYWAGFDLFDEIDNISLCSDVEQADFVCCVQLPQGDYLPVLHKMAARDLALICVNPDLVVLHNGQLAACPGTLALTYQQMGGKVIYRGKPYAQGYQACFDFCESRNLAAIGDGLLTDIKGANDMGLDSYFVANGIHGEKLSFDAMGCPSAGSLESLFKFYDVTPTATMPRFMW